MPEMSPPPPTGTTTASTSGRLVEQFKTDGALSGDDILVVEGVDEGVAVLVAQLQRALVGVVRGTGHEAHLGAELLGGLHLGDGCALGQTDERLDAHGGGAECHTLRVVARRAGDDALLLFLFGELRDFVVGAANLERACLLQTFGFQIHVAFGVDFRGMDEVRAADDLVEHIACLIEIV